MNPEPMVLAADISTGERLYALAERLFPICRSITGEGVRHSLAILQEYIPLVIREVASGTPVLDWNIPREWNIRDAWIKAPDGRKIVDFKKHNLHVLNYSVPVRRTLELADLKKHLYTLPAQPDLIPYRTSYYQEQWGFCLSHRQYEALEEGTYEICIDASLEAGSLSYGELYIPGARADEVLFSAHICHPSLANDNLSGISLLTFLAQELLQRENRYSYRFLFIPGTIGAIAWLALNKDRVHRVKHGLVASLLGDSAGFSYKKSRRGNAEIDQVVEQVLQHSGHAFQIADFSPYGYDERQFCSPGFNLPVGNLSRSVYGQYPEYHTSGDDLQLIRPVYLEESFQLYRQIVQVLEQNGHFQNLSPYGEPQLGKRGLYDSLGGRSDHKALQMAMLWVLNFSDGKHSLLEIAQRANLPFEQLVQASRLLRDAKLLAPVVPEHSESSIKD